MLIVEFACCVFYSVEFGLWVKLKLLGLGNLIFEI